MFTPLFEKPPRSQKTAKIRQVRLKNPKAFHINSLCRYLEGHWGSLGGLQKRHFGVRKIVKKSPQKATKCCIAERVANGYWMGFERVLNAYWTGTGFSGYGYGFERPKMLPFCRPERVRTGGERVRTGSNGFQEKHIYQINNFHSNEFESEKKGFKSKWNWFNLLGGPNLKFPTTISARWACISPNLISNNWGVQGACYDMHVSRRKIKARISLKLVCSSQISYPKKRPWKAHVSIHFLSLVFWDFGQTCPL